MRYLVCVALVLLGGCRTAYEPMGYSGGYLDWPLGPGRHHIEVTGNGYTSATTLRYYFHRRAMELCNAEGFSGYAGASATAGRDYTTPAQYTVSRDSNGDATVSQTGGYTVTKYGVQGDVTCVGPTNAAVQQAPPPASQANPAQYRPQQPEYNPACIGQCQQRALRCKEACQGNAGCAGGCDSAYYRCADGC